MNAKTVKIVIIVLCLAALVAFLAIKQPWKSGGAAAPGTPTLPR